MEDDHIKPEREFDTISDEELVARFTDRVDAGELPFQLVIQVEDRGIECLASDPAMQTVVQDRMDAWSENWKDMSAGARALADQITEQMGIGKAVQQTLASVPKVKIEDLAGIQHLSTSAQQALGSIPKIDKSFFIEQTKMSKRVKAMLDGIAGPQRPNTFKLSGLVERPGIGGLIPHDDTDYDAIFESLMVPNPAAHQRELIHTLELGFGSMQEELAAQRLTLNEQCDALNDMKTSLATLDAQARKRWSNRVIVATACIAALGTVVGIAIAILRPVTG